MTAEWPAGEVAFVTGAASGIGLGIARALVAAGAKVALADIDAERLDAVTEELTEAGGTVLAVPLDISDAEAWTAAADRAEEALGPVSILSNNAGAATSSPVGQIKLELWQWVFRVNAEAQLIATQTFLPRFQSRGGHAHIMHTSSMAGVVPIGNTAAYNASKFASLGFCLTLREELRGSDITVSVLLPGTTATRISETGRIGEAKVLGTEPNRELIAANRALTSVGADPDRVGEQVVEAMAARQFLIITHKDWYPLVKRIHDEFDKAYAEFDGRHGADETALKLAAGSSPVNY